MLLIVHSGSHDGVTSQLTPKGGHDRVRRRLLWPRRLSAIRADRRSSEFDTTEFVPQWDAGWKGATGGSTVIGFSVPSRDAVDAMYAALTGAGYRGHQKPYDALWGARYAIVEDPDGNGIGLMSPIDEQRKYWPPEPPPSGQ